MKKRKEKRGMLPDRVSNPGPLIYESDALPIALRGPAQKMGTFFELGKDKAAKGEGWALPFISCAQDTVGL